MKEFLIDKKDLTIYCDMDGVLVNFDKQAEKILGIPYRNEIWKGRSEEKWRR